MNVINLFFFIILGEISPRRPVIGKNVVQASLPSRKPPPPPEDSDEGPCIRVAGTVTPTEQKVQRDRPTTWITRTEPMGGNKGTACPQFLHTRSGDLFPQEENVSHRTKLVREVVSSEESYVSSLKTLVHHYYHPLRVHPDKKVSIHMPTIFGNIESILQLNSDLLTELQQRIKKWSDKQLLGDIFIRIAPFLKLYAKYGTNYENAINLYQKEMKENSAFKDAVELRNLEAGTSVHLHHLLIQPIQRIPRYNMLLTDIIKHTDSSHPDYNNLINALESTKFVATHLNESVRESEMERSLVELAERMEITLILAPHRRLLKEGSFKIIVGKKEKRNLHYLMLFNDILICISRSKIKKPSEFTNSWNNYPLDLIWFFHAPKHEKYHCLRIINPSYSFIVLFETLDELESWKKLLTTSVKNNLKSQPINENNHDLNSPTIYMDEENQILSSRYGSFRYPDNSKYTGWFYNGSVSYIYI